MPVDGNRIVAIIAPIAGVFYRAPSQQDPPYVELGSKVSPRQVLCLLETMKVFSKVRSTVQGRIVEIGSANGEPVAKGQALFRIEQI